MRVPLSCRCWPVEAGYKAAVTPFSFARAAGDRFGLTRSRRTTSSRWSDLLSDPRLPAGAFLSWITPAFGRTAIRSIVTTLDADIQLTQRSRDRLGSSERGVEFVDRTAPGLDPDHQVGGEREHVPDREIVEAGTMPTSVAFGLT